MRPLRFGGLLRSAPRAGTPALALAAVVGLVLLAAGVPRAQDASPPPTTTTTVPAADDIGFGSPRSTVRGFLEAARNGDWDTAASHLDLRGAPAGRGPALARELKTILDRCVWIDLEEVSADPAGEVQDGLPERRELLGTIPTSTVPAKILLERVPGPNAQEWKFARVTVQQIPALWAEFGDGPLAEALPTWMREVRVLDVELWQWIALSLLLGAAPLVAWVLSLPLVRLARVLAARTGASAEGALGPSIEGPVRLALAVTVFWAGLYLIWLPLFLHRFLVTVLEALLALFVTWTLLRAIDGAANRMTQRMWQQGHVAATSVARLGRRVLKVFVVVIAGLVVLQNIGLNVTGVIAGLGIGGLAVALAAQKSLENLFGGISVIADQAVRVGDFCRFGDRTGTVEDIGLRSTRIRTPERTVVVVPNGQFGAMQIENFALRDRILLSATFGVRYETTPDQLRYLLIEAKRMLLAHPMILPEPARVRFTNLGAAGLEIELFAYVRTADAEQFAAVREDVLLRMLEIVAQSGTAFAYAGAVGGLDAERRKAAEETVARWRREGRLYLPAFPREEVKALAGTLDWPPGGSPR